MENLGKKLAAVTSDKDELSTKWRHCREELDTSEFRCRELERTAEKAARNTQVILLFPVSWGPFYAKMCISKNESLKNYRNYANVLEDLKLRYRNTGEHRAGYYLQSNLKNTVVRKGFWQFFS